jgi:RNA polymerase sigma-70 factor (ECF subfamily)
MNTTSASLLERLRDPGEQAAWERFVKLYTPLLCLWARQVGVPAQEIADFVQDVFAVLVERLPLFRYDPGKRFRGWLWTVALNKWRQAQRRRCLVPCANGAAILSELVIADSIEVLGETEYRHYLTQRALRLMQAEFTPSTWQAFWECAVAGKSAAATARQLGITENAVYLAKSRVLRRLRRELAGLLD